MLFHYRIGKKVQSAGAFGEWLRTDKPRNDYSEKTFCPRRSWPDVTLRIQKERLKQPSHTIAKSTTDVASTIFKEKNELCLNREIEYLNKDLAVKDNALEIGQKNHLENVRNSSKSVKIGTGRILCEKHGRIQENSSRGCDKQLLQLLRKIPTENVERTQNIIYPTNHKNKYIGRICEDRSTTTAVISSTKQSQDARLLQRKEFPTTLHEYDLQKKVSCGNKRSTVIIQSK